MPYPYNYTYFKPTGKEQGAMAIGSLLAGLLAAGQPRQPGEASPVLRGIEGALTGYGGGYKAYQDMMGDAWQRDLADRGFGLSERQYEETVKPESMAKINYYNQRETPKLPNEVITYEYGQNIKNPRQRSEFMNRAMPLRRENQTNISVNTGGDAEKEEQKVIGRTMGESYQELQKDAQNARNEIDMFGTLKELSSQTQTGKLEPFKTQLAGYAQALGVPVSSKYNANQMFEAISNKLTVMARKVGEGQILAGQISDADREFLKKSVPELSKLPQANEMLINWNMKLAERRIKLAELGEDYYNTNGTMKGFNEARKQWVNQNPIFKDSQQTIPQTTTKESALQELFDLAQKGDPEALRYFRSKGIK